MTQLDARDNGRILKFNSEVFELLVGKTIQSVEYVDNETYETLIIATSDGLKLIADSEDLSDGESSLSVRMENT